MKRLVILAAPRTGSNWLCTLLDSHPEILCHHEIFNPDGIHYSISHRNGALDFGTVTERDADVEAVLDRIWEQNLGSAVVGFKMTRGQSPVVLRRVLEDPEIRKIVVRRRNRVKTFVSEQVAAATGEWESYPDSPRSTQPIRVGVDADGLQRHIAQNEQFYDEIDAVLQSTRQEALSVTYEDLNADEERRRLLRFLDVEDMPLSGATRKQLSRNLRDVISNFDELAATLQNSELAAELHAPGL